MGTVINDIFYVYEHWRPDKDSCFYVGKGKGKRAYTMRKRNNYHTHIQMALESIGLSVDVRILHEGLSEASAHKLEIERIGYWRSCGVDLCNVTDGGEGSTGYKHSESSRKRLSEKLRGIKKSKEWRDKIGKAHLGMKRAPHVGKLIAELNRQRIVSKETCLRIGAANKGKKRSPEFCARISERNRGRVWTDEMREKLQNRVYSYESRKKISDALSGRRLPKETREKISASLIGNSRTKGKKLSDEHKSKLSAAFKGRFVSEETKARMALARAEWWARKRAAANNLESA